MKTPTIKWHRSPFGISAYIQNGSGSSISVSKGPTDFKRKVWNRAYLYLTNHNTMTPNECEAWTVLLLFSSRACRALDEVLPAKSKIKQADIDGAFKICVKQFKIT